MDYRPSTPPLNNKQVALMSAAMIGPMLYGYLVAKLPTPAPWWFYFLGVALGSGYYHLTKAIVRLR